MPRLVAASIVCLAVSQSVGRPTVESLAGRVEALEARVAALESQAATQPPTAAVPTPSPCGQACRVLSIEVAPATAEALEAAEAAAKAANEAESRARDANAKDDTSESSASRLATAAKRARAEANRLRREVDARRHRITGWNGVRRVVLTSDGDLTAALAKVGIGDYIEWTGTAVRMDAESEEWQVARVVEIDRPRGYIDPPAQVAPPPVPDSPAAQLPTPPSRR